MDEAGRGLLRAWRATGDVGDGEAWLRARLRGGLPRERVELLALLGEPSAARALDGGPRAELAAGGQRLRPEEARAWLARRAEADDRPGGHGERRDQAARQLRTWAEALVPGGQLRAALAAGRLAVERCDGAGATLAAVDAAEALVGCPCRGHAARLLDAEAALPAPRSPGPGPDLASYAKLAADGVVAAVVEGGHARGLDVGWAISVGRCRAFDRARDARERAASFHEEVAAVAAALAPWALGDDPLRARHGALDGEPPIDLDPPAREARGWEVVQHPTELPENPFDHVPTPPVEVRRGALVWTGAAQLLTAALRRLRLHLLAGLRRPVTTLVDATRLLVPYPPGTAAEQLAAVEEAIAAHEAWRGGRRGL